MGCFKALVDGNLVNRSEGVMLYGHIIGWMLEYDGISSEEWELPEGAESGSAAEEKLLLGGQRKGW